MVQKYSIGIDLGTTYSSLAYVDEEGRVQSLRLPDGGYTVASAIYFQTANEVIVGEEALKYALIDSDRVARKFKRAMGNPDYRFECDGLSLRPEELSAMVLKKLLQAAQEQLGPIDEAVISVPFVFDEVRRQATVDAGRIAGLNSINLVDEPVAAGIAYGHKLFAGRGRWDSKELDELFGSETILVYDLGGGTFDATIMRVSDDGTFKVLATGGDWELGGEDWDDVLVHQLAEACERTTHCDVRSEKQHMQELRTLAVEAKKALSERPQTQVEFGLNGQRVKLTLTRGDFERDSRHLIARTEDTLLRMLTENNWEWNLIDRVLLVGGSSRMRQVPVNLERIIGEGGNRRLDMSLPPDTAIAHGAALYAAFHSGNKNVVVKDVVTVNSHPLGLMVRDPESQQLVNDVLLKANLPTLKSVTREYDVPEKDGSVQLIVLLGDAEPNACAQLGSLRITGIPKQAKNPQIRVSFCFQENGLLAVEGIVEFRGGKPIRANTQMIVAGKMKEEDVVTSAKTLRGVEIT